MRVRSSSLKAWKRCPRHWYLSYYRDLRRVRSLDEPVDLADIGTQVHRALQDHYMARPVTEPEDEKAWIMVQGYLEWVAEEGADVGLRVTGVEEPIEADIVDLDGNTHTLTGTQDLVVFDEAHGRSFLMDHKTVGNLDQYGHQLKVDDQLLNYVLLRRLSGLDTAGAIHNMLRRVKRTARSTPPYYGRRQVVFNDTHLRAHYHHVQSTLTGMNRAVVALEQGTDHQIVVPPTPLQSCTYDCSFLPVCPLMDDGSDWEGMLAHHYGPREGT